MASIAQLKRLLTDFANYKVSVSVTASYMIKSSNLLGNVSENADNNYSINDDGSNVGVVAKSLKESCAETSNYLKNTVIPAIDSKMDEIEREIERLEEEERRREEEAAAAAAAARRASFRSFRW